MYLRIYIIYTHCVAQKKKKPIFKLMDFSRQQTIREMMKMVLEIILFYLLYIYSYTTFVLYQIVVYS